MSVRPRAATARRLRRDATVAERIFWRALLERCPGWRFRRQHPIGTRIADFACPTVKLAIELDGGQHTEADDAARTAELACHGHRVIRFWNNDVIDNMDGVLEMLTRTLDSLSSRLGGEG